MITWLYVHLGIAGNGPYYGFWSGFGSDLAEFGIIGALIANYRRHNCHVRGCWRVAKHPVDGTPYITCRRHHPDLSGKAPTRTAIEKAHADAHPLADDLARMQTVAQDATDAFRRHEQNIQDLL